MAAISPSIVTTSSSSARLDIKTDAQLAILGASSALKNLSDQHYAYRSLKTRIENCERCFRQIAINPIEVDPDTGERLAPDKVRELASRQFGSLFRQANAISQEIHNELLPKNLRRECTPPHRKRGRVESSETEESKEEVSPTQALLNSLSAVNVYGRKASKVFTFETNEATSSATDRRSKRSDS